MRLLASSGACATCVRALRVPGWCSALHRPEPGFLLQGVLEAPGSYVATPRHPNPPQPTTMRRGMVCWAAGGGGPHWFVNVSGVVLVRVCRVLRRACVTAADARVVPAAHRRAVCATMSPAHSRVQLVDQSRFSDDHLCW
jgi:hypothetical protein